MSHDPKLEIEPNEINDRFTKEWNAAVGANPFKGQYTLLELAADVRNRLIDRVGDVGPGDRVTARLMLEAVGVIREAGLEIERLRIEVERIRMNTGCARQQFSTQYCAEALDAQRELEKLRAEVARLNAWPYVPERMPDIVDRLLVMDSTNGCDNDHLFDGILVDAAQEIKNLRAELRTYTDGTNDEVQREAL